MSQQDMLGQPRTKEIGINTEQFTVKYLEEHPR